MRTHGTPKGAPVLTRRQIEILQMYANGMIYKEIANETGLSYQTVKNHITAVNARLGVNAVGHSIAEAIRLGLIE